MTDRIRALPLLLLFPLLMGISDMRTTVHKVPKSTLVEGTATATLHVPFQTLSAVLCDYPVGASFSTDDPVDFQAVVNDAVAQRLREQPPEELDDFRAIAVTGTAPARCPGGENWVAAQIDLPWPLSDAWQLSQFQATSATTDLTIHYQFVAGSARESSGYWYIRDLGHGRSELTNRFHFDVGFRIPEFLIRWGVNSALPDFFEDIETFARQYDLPVSIYQA
ncbi:MAG: hypothetical protein D6761_12455, partial [Candidatus Dadabacteria bacterium]